MNPAHAILPDMDDLKSMDDAALLRLLDNNDYFRKQMEKRGDHDAAREAERTMDALVDEFMRRRPKLRDLLTQRSST